MMSKTHDPAMPPMHPVLLAGARLARATRAAVA